MKHIYLRVRDEQDQFLRTLSGSIAEHIRRAIDDYIQKKKNSDVSISMSQWKGGKDE